MISWVPSKIHIPVSIQTDSILPIFFSYNAPQTRSPTSEVLKPIRPADCAFILGQVFMAHNLKPYGLGLVLVDDVIYHPPQQTGLVKYIRLIAIHSKHVFPEWSQMVAHQQALGEQVIKIE